MKKIKLSKFVNLLFIPFILCGCNNTSCSNSCVTYLTSQDEGTATIRIYKDNNSTSKERYISPDRVNLSFTYNDLSGTLSNNENVCPSIGDVNLLVIPVHIPGCEEYKTDEIKEDIQKVFFSNDDSELGYKSVKQYYHEASYGKLNFGGVVTDWFDVETHTSVKSVDDITQGNNGTIVTEILRKAVDWAIETQNIDIKDYDKNEDGSIDAVWLVYNHLDMVTEFDFEQQKDIYFDSSNINQAFWNFTYWDWETLPDIEKPTTSGFSWASFDMMYTSYCNRDTHGVAIFDDFSSIKLDSHTYIHETGHLLGLDDYYASDDNYYRPAGSTTMMDQNICDLDSYSKMLLGWVTPYVVYGTSEILIGAANKFDNQVIVIPSNYEEISNTIESRIAMNTIDTFTYDFNPFSEYIMIDLYTPDGLNYEDTYGTLIHDRKEGITSTGVRIYHVDSRIFKCSVVDYMGGQKLSYVDGYVWDEKNLKSNEAILMPISNNKTEHNSYQLPEEFDYFDQLRLLEATRINTFDKGEYANYKTLFTPTSGDFDIKSFGYQFFDSSYTFNSGNDLDFKINVKTLKEVSLNA